MHKRYFLALATTALLATSVGAAPLSIPEVSNSARDSMRILQERGLIQGYPDGTLKGDRVSSRFEVAMLVARLLADMEKTQQTFADKQSLAALKQLTGELHNELGALNVRVTALDEAQKRLDQRVTEIERITFYGSLEARAVMQSFHNSGAVDNDDGRRGKGTTGVPYLNYNDVVGSTGGVGLRPQTHGVLPVVDYRNGRALVNGAGFTSKAILGLKLKVSPDIDGGVEFAAYTSQGNSAVDAYWGVSAPFLLNPFTSNAIAGGAADGLTHGPWTSMVLDNVWVEHKPSKTKLRFGNITNLQMDKFIFRGQPNLGVYGPPVFPGFGRQVTGQFDLCEKNVLRYEIFNVLFGDLNVFGGTNYSHNVSGGDIDWDFGRGGLKLNFAYLTDGSPGDQHDLQGLHTGTNVPYQASVGWTPTQWVNPAGYFVNQLTGGQTRPIAGWLTTSDTGGPGPGTGNFGPQRQTTYGASFRYNMPVDDSKLRFNLDYGHSLYKSNKYATFEAGGDVYRFEVTANPADTNLELAAAYVAADPHYNAALYPGNFLGIRFVRPFNFVGRFQMYDTNTYPVNREGLQLKANWQFDEGHGTLGARANLLHQKTTSLYDVRVPAGSIGAGSPTLPVLGFSPGFQDPVFAGFASPFLYGKLSGSSFSDNLVPLENPRGTQQDYGLNFSYRWDDPGVKVDVAYERSHWSRPTSLAANFGGSQNAVDLTTEYINLAAQWKFAPAWTLKGGCEWVLAHGHHDPGGLYNGFAVANQSTNFVNLDTTQTIPTVGIDWQMSKTTAWSTEFRYYSTRDHVTAQPGLGTAARGITANPFNWEGPQLSTEFKLTF